MKSKIQIEDMYKSSAFNGPPLSTPTCRLYARIVVFHI